MTATNNDHDGLTATTMTDTDHDDQTHNLLKFVQRHQTLTVVKRLYIWREIVQLGHFTPRVNCHTDKLLH